MGFRFLPLPFLKGEGRKGGFLFVRREKELGLAQGTFLSRTIKRLVGVMFTLGAGSRPSSALKDSRFIYEMSL